MASLRTIICVIVILVFICNVYYAHFYILVVSTGKDPYQYSKLTLPWNSSFKDLQQPVVRERVIYIYNRVPKCGSRLVKKVLLELSETNNFSFHEDKQYLDLRINDTAQRHLVETMYESNAPLVFERQIHFINFTKFHHKMPAYFNVIREPVDRLASWYYFIRFQPGHMREMSEVDRNRTYDECVEMEHPECVNESNYFTIIPFFCGQADFCTEPGHDSLARAMQNVERYYPVVGIMEGIEQFFLLLERKLGHLFKGAVKTYKKRHQETILHYKTVNKTDPTEVTREKMRQRLLEETLFYEFIKQRFYDMVKHIPIDNAIL